MTDQIRKIVQDADRYQQYLMDKFHLDKYQAHRQWLDECGNYPIYIAEYVAKARNL